MKAKYYYTKEEAEKAANKMLAKMKEHPCIISIFLKGYIVTGQLGGEEEACIFTYPED